MITFLRLLQKKLISIVFFILTLPVFASVFDSKKGVLGVPDTDMSKIFLSRMFGYTADNQMIVSQGLTIDMISDLIRVFNGLVLLLLAILFSYWTIVGILDAVNKGDPFGPRISVPWALAKSSIGISLLTPTVSGYNYLQIIIFYIVLKGVGAANSVWNVVVENYEQGNNIVLQNTPDSNDFTNAYKDLSVKLVSISMCMSNLKSFSETEGWKISPIYYATDNSFSSENDFEYNFGFQDLEGFRYPICGKFSVPKVIKVGDKRIPGNRLFEDIKNIIIGDILNSSILGSAISEKDFFVNIDDLRRNDVLSFYINLITKLKNILLIPVEVDKSEVMRSAGWMYAGAYYFELSRASEVNASAYSVDDLNSDFDFGFREENIAQRKLIGISEKAAKYLYNLENRTSKKFIDSAISFYNEENKRVAQNQGAKFDNLGESYSFAWGNIGLDMVQSLFKAFPAGALKDPIPELAKWGQNGLLIIESTFIYVITLMSVGAATFLSLGVAKLVLTKVFQGGLDIVGSLAMAQSVLQKISTGAWFLALPSSIFALAIMPLLFINFAMCAYYFPLLPYIIFLLAFIGWVIEIVRVIIGSSVLGLALIVPSEDELGRAGTGIFYMLIVAFRPLLMIVGFVFAGKLFAIVFGIYIKGFQVAFNNAAYISLLSAPSALMLFVGIIPNLLVTCFSLIYKLPDNVFSWIGNRSENSEVEKVEQEIRSNVQHSLNEVQERLKFGMNIIRQKSSPDI